MSNETKWTKGPWVIAFNGYYFDVGPKNNSKDITVFPNVCIGVPNELEANANLIAAAPELYDALNYIVTKWYGDVTDGGSDELNKAISALAKARGES